MLDRFFKKKLPQEKAQALLLKGTQSSNLNKIDKALEAGADINHGYAGVTVLSFALHESKEELGLELLKRGANPLIRSQFAPTPIQVAGDKGMEKFIAAAAAKCPSEDIRPVLKKALYSTDNIKGLQALIAAGADINTYRNGMWTPLYWRLRRMMHGDPQKIFPYFHAMLDAGADLHASTPEGKPLRDTINDCGRKKLLDNLITEHTAKLQERLTCEPGAGIDPQRLIQDGKPTPELLNYCGAHMLPELFTEHRWKGKSGEALALFEELKPLLPDYYKPMLQAIDLTPLRREVTQKDSGPAVARYVRNRPAVPPEAER